MVVRFCARPRKCMPAVTVPSNVSMTRTARTSNQRVVPAAPVKRQLTLFNFQFLSVRCIRAIDQAKTTLGTEWTAFDLFEQSRCRSTGYPGPKRFELTLLPSTSRTSPVIRVGRTASFSSPSTTTSGDSSVTAPTGNFSHMRYRLLSAHRACPPGMPGICTSRQS